MHLLSCSGERILLPWEWSIADGQMLVCIHMHKSFEDPSGDPMLS